MSYLHYLCLFVYSGVQYILCCVFVLFCLRLVYPTLPVSLDYPFSIAPSVFSNIYLVNGISSDPQHEGIEGYTYQFLFDY